MEDAILVEEYEAERYLGGLRLYETALHKAAHMSEPLLANDEANRETGRVWALTARLESLFEDEEGCSGVRSLRPVCAEDKALLRAMLLVNAMAEGTRLEGLIRDLKSGKAEARTCEQQRALDEQIETLAAALEETRIDNVDSHRDALSQLLLPLETITGLGAPV